MNPYLKTENGILYHGDNVEVLKTFDKNCIDLGIMSPPYDNLRKYEGYSWDFEALAKELFRVTKPGGVVVWVVGDATIDGSETGTSFRQALYFKEIGFNIHDTMIYKSSKPPSNHNRYENEFEYMFIFSKGKPKTFNPIKIKKAYIDKRENKKFHRNVDNGWKKNHTKNKHNKYRIIGNIWEYNPTNKTDHPAVFPEKLARDHIISWSNKGDMVLDCFAGSGTTLKEAEKLHRKYIGIEISDKYCEIIKKRLYDTEPTFKFNGDK